MIAYIASVPCYCGPMKRVLLATSGMLDDIYLFILEAVARAGFIKGYVSMRIVNSGRRFRIEGGP